MNKIIDTILTAQQINLLIDKYSVPMSLIEDIEQNHNLLIEKAKAEEYRWINNRLETGSIETDGMCIDRKEVYIGNTTDETTTTDAPLDFSQTKWGMEGNIVCGVPKAKDTKGKPNWNLVNLKEFEGVVRVREAGVKKYPEGGVDNWKKVPVEEFFNALKRHIVEMDNKGIYALDEESGLLALDHAICNLYFIRSLR